LAELVVAMAAEFLVVEPTPVEIASLIEGTDPQNLR